jgi:hypothetical protein
MEKMYSYSVWATQGGGLVREVGEGVYIFVEKPTCCSGLDVDDIMPEEWSIIPANDLARYEMDRIEWGPDDQAMFDADLELMFDMLFEKANAGEISYDQMGQFFPQKYDQKGVKCHEVSNV